MSATMTLTFTKENEQRCSHFIKKKGGASGEGKLCGKKVKDEMLCSLHFNRKHKIKPEKKEKKEKQYQVTKMDNTSQEIDEAIVEVSEKVIKNVFFCSYEKDNKSKLKIEQVQQLAFKAGIPFMDKKAFMFIYKHIIEQIKEKIREIITLLQYKREKIVSFENVEYILSRDREFNKVYDLNDFQEFKEYDNVVPEDWIPSAGGFNVLSEKSFSV